MVRRARRAPQNGSRTSAQATFRLLDCITSSGRRSAPALQPTGVTMSTPTIRLLAAAAGLAVTGGGLVSALPVQAATSTPSCTNADLSASYRHSDDGAGHSYGWIVLRNTS